MESPPRPPRGEKGGSFCWDLGFGFWVFHLGRPAVPDLLTHFVAARVPGALLRDRRLQALLIIGTFLPDLASKGLYWILQSRDAPVVFTHSFVGILLLSYLSCLFVEESLRRSGFILLAAGGFIHILLDLVKDNQGVGGLLFLPFSTSAAELSWIDPENIVFLIPIDAAILAAIWFLERRAGRGQP